eukprot:scaffold20755_cov136-Isochrysis_galbana.AAC.3
MDGRISKPKKAASFRRPSGAFEASVRTLCAGTRLIGVGLAARLARDLDLDLHRCGCGEASGDCGWVRLGRATGPWRAVASGAGGRWCCIVGVGLRALRGCRISRRASL